MVGDSEESLRSGGYLRHVSVLNNHIEDDLRSLKELMPA